MASTTVLTPTSKPQTLPSIKSRPTTANATPQPLPLKQPPPLRRHFLTLSAGCILSPLFLSPLTPAFASSDEEYVKDAEYVITKVRTTINMDKNDPNIATAVADLRDASNNWVAKYRREKALIGKASFRDIYSALNAVSGHYISFGPTAPIPAKRKARILEEMDTAEKALSRGR
ncbi:photosystem II repair protein PSB27-H1, chloroplastic-like [Mangifera indica]|uniref:photosystem II repair protein PSB27-H1, chloroplastic-like n=1 Tax=Mangifera indica TaxID=29780 RepID=UPI001CF9FCD8|nr:photosystem II repair protein PSB27-H1, chloroplastic-like [Mangifera indica]